MCIRTSEAIDAISAALAKAQPEIEGAEKNAQNPHLRNRYANLTAIVEAIRPALAAHGLAVIQGISTVDGGVSVTTRLLHESGQWIESSLTMPVDKATAQAVGSAITYGRRYGLSALLGVTPDEDDDGHAASQAPPQRRTQAAPPAKRAQTGTISEAQRKRLYALAKAHKPDEIKAWLAAEYGIESSTAIPAAKYDEICARLERPAPLVGDDAPPDDGDLDAAFGPATGTDDL